MSRFEEEQGPGPGTTDGQAQEPEPRLLTRPVDTQGDDRWTRSSHRKRFAAMDLGAAWVARLRRSREAVPERELESPGTRDGNPEPVVLTRTPERLPTSRRRRKRPLWVAAVCLLLIALTGLAVVLDLRHALHASLPQLDGDVHIAGLQAPVTVTRDAQGVPTITAANLDDLLFAQGYVTAGDRLWQMDGLRRHAAGELAEILGPGLVEHDRRQRYLQIRAAADRAVAALPHDQYAQLQAYARGVNAYLDAHRGALPMEFRLLAYKPAPWSPRDSLLVSLAIYQDMSTGFPQKLNREALSAHLSSVLMADLYPVGSWRDLPPGAQNRDVTAPHEVEQIPLDPSQSRLGTPRQPGTPRAEDLLAVSNGLAGGLAGERPDRTRCEGCRPGSNNWVVSGLHTASGGALLSNDMHLNLGIPDVWYEASLHADLQATAAPGARLDVVGFTLPGVPFVIAGRNAHLAWGLTNLGADVEDLRVEHLRGTGDNTEFQRPDSTWALAGHRSERIRVRGGRDVSLDVLTTTHTVGDLPMETPVISPLYPSEHRALSLAWTAYDPGTVTAPFLPINTAVDGASLVAAFAGFGGPTLNLVWADDRNHIGYHAVGRVPVRGPAVQHPRAVELPVPANAAPGTLPPDEGDQPVAEPSDTDDSRATPDSPQAALLGAPHLQLSAFHPVHRRLKSPQRSSGRVRRTARRQSQRRPAPAPMRPVPVETAPLPAPQPLNYTVGSPLSPVPVDALDASQAWSGYIGYGDLPAVTDPSNGLLATANSRITPDDYPWAVASDWVDPYRTERIVHLLTGHNGLTAADMLRVQTDVHSDVDQAIAHRLAYALDHASAKSLGSDGRRLRQAADLLRDFDGNMTATSPAAALVSAVRTQLWPALLIPQIAAHDAHAAGPAPATHQAALVSLLYTANERTTALELMLQNQPPRWLPRAYTRWSDFLAAVTENALKAAHAPGDLRRWQYGELHTVEIAHPLLGDQRLVSDLLGIRSTTGQQPAPGDATTVKQTGAHFGPSERFTADLSSATAAFANLTTGESEDAQSPWYLDQFQPWLQGTTFPMPLSGARSLHTLRLLPR